MASNSRQLTPDFFGQVEKLETSQKKIQWYYTVIVNLAALNYPELIPTVWDHIASHLFPNLSHDEQFKTAQKFREVLIKACGIMGAAKTGTALRILCQCVPAALRDPERRRAQENPDEASARGYAFHKRIYGQNPDFDSNATTDASPEYAYVVRDLLYGRVFSYDGILNDLETGHVIVSTLYGIDCQTQLRNHMKGMLYNGATREDVEGLRDLCLGLAKRLGVTFKSEAQPIPTIN